MISHHAAEITAGWTYLRFHGQRAHRGNYSLGALEAQAERIEGFLRRGLDVYAYFNNDVRGYAIKNALALRRMLEPAIGPGRRHGLIPA